MKVYFDNKREPEHGRTHPWTSSEGAKYHDFKKHPELISGALEDFKPWDHYKAIRGFYGLLKWINGPLSALESNDCAFRGAYENTESLQFAKKFECSGRLMVFYRRTDLNIMKKYTDALGQAIHHYLSQIEPSLEWGCAAITYMPVRFIDLPGDEKDQEGKEIMLTFWAWGDSEKETMENLRRVFGALSKCFRLVSGDIKAACA